MLTVRRTLLRFLAGICDLCFPQKVKTSLGVHSFGIGGSFCVGKAAKCVKQTVHLPLVARSRMSGVLLSLRHTPDGVHRKNINISIHEKDQQDAHFS